MGSRESLALFSASCLRDSRSDSSWDSNWERCNCRTSVTRQKIARPLFPDITVANLPHGYELPHPRLGSDFFDNAAVFLECIVSNSCLEIRTRWRHCRSQRCFVTLDQFDYSSTYARAQETQPVSDPLFLL